MTTLRTLCIFGISGLLAAAGCQKKNKDKGTKAYEDIEKTFDSSEPPAAERKPVAGANLEGVDAEAKALFEKMADTLPSPCGKAHSLRTSRNSDSDCRRAPFAVDYVLELAKDGAPEDDLKELYARWMELPDPVEIPTAEDDLHVGPADAPVKVVEYFDYGCPACKMMAPVVTESQEAMSRDVVVFYKAFPLDKHVDSPTAAAAAIAAHKQGKFKEMHKLLFDVQLHKEADVKGHAQRLGLDVAAFDAAVKAAAAKVQAEKEEGIKLGVSSTPTIYINGRRYEGPQLPKYMQMWLSEAAAGLR